jgi:hypothetical protein
LPEQRDACDPADLAPTCEGFLSVNLETPARRVAELFGAADYDAALHIPAHAGWTSGHQRHQHPGVPQRETPAPLARHGPAEPGRQRARRLRRHCIGTGIKPVLHPDASIKEQIQSLWLRWTDEADASGLTDFYGLQAMACRSVMEAGECFIRLRPRLPKDGLSVPLQLQLLEAEHLQLERH